MADSLGQKKPWQPLRPLLIGSSPSIKRLNSPELLQSRETKDISPPGERPTRERSSTLGCLQDAVNQVRRVEEHGTRRRGSFFEEVLKNQLDKT